MLLARGEPTWWGGVQTWFLLNDWATHLVYMLLAGVMMWALYRWMDRVR